MSSNSITLPLTPIPAPRMTDSDRWKTVNNKNIDYRQRDCVSRYFAYKDAIVLLCKRAKYELQPELTVAFYMPMPKTWSMKKKKEMQDTPHQVRPDLDNLIKGLMDAFGIDDSFVYRIVAIKKWDFEGRIVLF